MRAPFEQRRQVAIDSGCSQKCKRTFFALFVARAHDFQHAKLWLARSHFISARKVGRFAPAAAALDARAAIYVAARSLPPPPPSPPQSPRLSALQSPPPRLREICFFLFSLNTAAAFDKSPIDRVLNDCAADVTRNIFGGGSEVSSGGFSLVSAKPCAAAARHRPLKSLQVERSFSILKEPHDTKALSVSICALT